MKYGSVCSGIEAATVAWHPLGWEPQFFAEIEPFPCSVLAHHYHDVPNFGDMTKFKEWPDATIDVLIGGTPCQSYSVAGLRAGLDDPRGDLMLTYVAVARRYRPLWVCWENVFGVLSSNKGRDFGSFLGLLTGQHIDAPPTGWQNSGVIPGYKGAYGVAWRVLDAQFAGVPQRRRRVFVVGYLGDWRRAAAVLFERHSLQGHSPPSRKAGAPVAALTANGVGTCGADDNQGQAGHLICQDVSATLKGGSGSRGWSCDDGAPVIGYANAGDAGNGGETVICMATGQASAEIGIGTTLNCNQEAPIVCGTLCNNGKASGSATQQDAENGMLVTHALTRRYDSSEDGCGRGTPIIPVVFNWQGGGTQTTLGYDPESDKTGSLSVGQTPAVAFVQNCRDEVRLMGGDGQIAGALSAEPGAKQQCYLAFNLRGREGGAMAEMAEMASLRASSGGSSRSYVAASAVRRLTPRECERLQEFPDDYTRIPVRFYKERKITKRRPADMWEQVEGGWRLMAADGPRYKSLGNSMHTGCIRWLGERIQMVTDLTANGAGQRRLAA